MGNVIGIVAEYNPFHNGHARLIEQTRAQLGAVCPAVSYTHLTLPTKA